MVEKTAETGEVHLQDPEHEAEALPGSPFVNQAWA
jgi:hypothetical protein